MGILPLRPNVCMLVFNKEKKLFLGERHGSSGVWQFPQGGVEPNSSLQENVLRELQEEIGVPANRLNIIGALKTTNEYEWEQTPSHAIGKWRGQSQTFWLVEFFGRDEEINLEAHEQEFMSWRWCTADEVRQMAEPKRLKGYSGALVEFEDYLKLQRNI